MKKNSKILKNAMVEGKLSTEDPTTQKWQQLFILTEHWQSDLQFFADELRFLHKLLEKNLIWLMVDSNIDKMRTLINSIIRLEKRRNTLSVDTKSHLTLLSELILNPFAVEHQKVEDTHGNKEKFLSDFVNEFRSVKKEVFALTESVLDSEKANHLLTR